MNDECNDEICIGLLTRISHLRGEKVKGRKRHWF